jgi:hypothetical protein
MNKMVTHNLQRQLDLEANRQVNKNQTEDKFENGKEYARLIETPYQNLMLDRRVLRTKERLVKHRSFRPQEVVWWDIWIGGFQRKHSSKRRSPWKEM